VNAGNPAVQAIEKLSNGQATILHEFDAPLGLEGMAVSLGGGRNMIMYASKDGKYIVIGGLFGADGHNYSMDAAQKYLPPHPAPPTAGANYAARHAAVTFDWGNPKAKKALWVVADPDCIFCHKTWVALKPAVNKGEVLVHVIPVGFLKPDSLGKAAAILGATDPAAALSVDESTFDDATEEGAIKPDLSNPKIVAEIKKNNAWMTAHGIGGTPYLFYMAKDGKPGVVPGTPSDVSALLDQIKPR
jgi:thiol:disulfide interchange protein DsbG